MHSVVRNLFRFMAYKDEFEVARLMTNGQFTKELSEKFEGDFSVKFHMAPPLLGRGKDERGRPLKQVFGPWLQPVLKVLSNARPLRGSVFNPFGYHEEARLHRELLSWYQDLLYQLMTSYTDANAVTWVEILACADEIRGYGPVRIKSAEAARKNVSQMVQDKTEQTA